MVGKPERKPSVSVVVVIYNMAREAPRTLYSLSAAYQRHINADDYEVIVIDNGSSPPFDPKVIEGLTGRFRLIRINPAPPSPAHAINRGIAEAQGEIVGVMIDGARVGVHIWGEPCAIDQPTEIAGRRNLKLVFDASHAFGCAHRGRMIGSFGDAEVFSFHATKYFNTLEGGPSRPTTIPWQVLAADKEEGIDVFPKANGLALMKQGLAAETERRKEAGANGQI